VDGISMLFMMIGDDNCQRDIQLNMGSKPQWDLVFPHIYEGLTLSEL
jgi:hypothetical protein